MMKKKITALLAGIFTLVTATYAQNLPTVSFTATPDSICPGGSVTIKDTSTYFPSSWTWYMPGSSLPYFYTTTAPGAPPSITYQYPGSYYIKCVVKNGAGSDSTTIQNIVVVKPAPTGIIMPPSGGICDVSGGVGFDTVFFHVIDTTNGSYSHYLWAPASNLSCSTCSNPNANPGTTTVYTLVITGKDGCTTTDYDTVTAGVIFAKITGRDSICAGTFDTLIASGGSVGGSNSNPQTTYSWSNGKTTSSIIVNPAVTTQYRVFIASGNGGACTSDTVFTVNVFPKPNYQIFSPDSICYPASANIYVLPHEGAYQYFWFGPPYGRIDTDNITVSPTVTTTYTLVARNFGCYSDSVIKIKVNYPPVVTFTGATDLCQGSSTTICASGGTQYIWSTGQTTSCINIVGIISKTFTVQVRRGACFKDTSFTVAVDTMPSTFFKGDTSICIGQSTTIYALPYPGHSSYGYSYLWNTGSTGDSVFTGPLTGSQTYYLTISKGACSKDSSEIKVKVYPRPNPKLFPNDTTVCEYDSVPLTAEGGNYYTWKPNPGSLNHYSYSGANDTDRNKAAPPNTTLYTVKVCTWGCCTGDTGLHPAIPSPTALVTIIPGVQGYSVCCSQTVKGGTPVQLSATYDNNPGYYISGWSPATGLSCTNCANPTATDYTTTTYVVTFADINGCTVQDSVTIDILNCDVFVPNAFSPNGDGVNDRLYVRSLCLKSMDFAVFDRWGNKVFETQNLNSGWDGTYKGKDMEVGTFVWYLTGLMDDGTHVSQNGNVTLVR